MLPFVLRRVGLDPATASAPFVATLVDITGLVIYFSVGFDLSSGHVALICRLTQARPCGRSPALKGMSVIRGWSGAAKRRDDLSRLFAETAAIVIWIPHSWFYGSAGPVAHRAFAL